MIARFAAAAVLSATAFAAPAQAQVPRQPACVLQADTPKKSGTGTVSGTARIVCAERAFDTPACAVEPMGSYCSAVLAPLCGVTICGPYRQATLMACVARVGTEAPAGPLPGTVHGNCVEAWSNEVTVRARCETGQDEWVTYARSTLYGATIQSVSAPAVLTC